MAKDGESQRHQPLANPTITRWLLEAVRKIKRQKQRPSVERINNAVKQYHKVSAASIEEQLELAVRDGAILKVFNKGLCSYKDPNRVLQLKTHTLNVTKKTDLTRVIIRSIKELGEATGSTLRSVEKYMRCSYNIDLADGLELSHQLRISAKKGLRNKLLSQEGRLFKVVVSSVEAESSDSVSGASSSTELGGATPSDRQHTCPEEIHVHKVSSRVLVYVSSGVSSYLMLLFIMWMIIWILNFVCTLNDLKIC